jgi:hypothetical protein
MSQDEDTTINWEPHEAEILSRYVGQNHTLENTMAYMSRTYGLKATYAPPDSRADFQCTNIIGLYSIRQYKKRFSGHKNLKAYEWIAVVEELQKRAKRGIDSEVYLYGRPIDRERIKREVRRYGNRTVTKGYKRGKA